MVSPANSKLIYRILKHYRQKPDSQLFKLLHLDPSNGGRRFKNGLNGKCWWPKHSDWFYNLVDGSREDDDVFFVDSQEFPLTGSRDELIHIVSLENEKDIQCYGGGQIRFLLDDCPRQMTFESCLYNVLIETFQVYAYNDFPEICKTVSGLCEQENTDPAAIERLKNQPDMDSLCRELVIMSKNSAGTDLLRQNSVVLPQAPADDDINVIFELERKMDVVLQKLEEVQEKIANAQNTLLEKISQQFDIQIRVQEQLMEELNALQHKSKLYYEECSELKQEVQVFVQNQQHAESEVLFRELVPIDWEERKQTEARILQQVRERIERERKERAELARRVAKDLEAMYGNLAALNPEERQLQREMAAKCCVPAHIVREILGY